MITPYNPDSTGMKLGSGSLAPKDSARLQNIIRKKPYPPRNSALSKQETSNILLLNQLKTEIQALSRRINLLQQDNQPNLDMVQHLGRILQNRQSVLHGLQSSN